MSSDPSANPMFQRKQDFGRQPTEVRQTDHYQHEYVHDFVERWDDLIDWDGRAASEGDFQSSYREADPDFFIHVAEKAYRPQDEDRSGIKQRQPSRARYSKAVKTTQAYYNSADADNFYSRVWGGEDIHIGLYEHPDELISDASHRTVERMAQTLGESLEGARVLDIGGGYGGSARHIARAHGADVVSLNLSEVQNERGRHMTHDQGLADKVTIVDGDFEDIPYDADTFDVVWSQDAMLHSGDRARVIAEAVRVLKPGGTFIFTDPMAADDCPEGVLQPVLDRIQLDTMGSPRFYRNELKKHGLTERHFADHSDQVPVHYDRVHQELNAHADELAGDISQTYVDNMRKGLQHWVDAGNAGYLAWGIMTFDN